MQHLTIARAASEAGVGIETIRFYERRGLIHQPPKPEGRGVRVYAPEQIRRIRFIRQAQQIGFSLQEIQELLSLRADPGADCSAVRNQAMTKLEEVKRKIADLQRIGSALEALIATCPGHGTLEACTILDALADPPSDPPQAKEAGMKSVTLKIEGMHCDGCAETLGALLRRESGVNTAAVTFEKGEARILFDPASTDEERLIAAAERPGFQVSRS